MSRTFPLAATGVAVVAASIVLLGTTPDPDPGPETPVDEITRVRVHLDRAVRFLDTYEPADLNASQSARRHRIVNMVAGYRDRAVFPHHHGSEPTDLYFVDEHGTPCALASVILATGRSDIVEAVRTRMNGAWVYQVMDDPELGPVLAAWLLDNGLSVADAATIQQPGYMRIEDPGPSNRDLSTGYAVASGVSLGLSAVTTTLNVVNFRSAGRVPAWLGLVSGAAAVGIGVTAMDTDGSQQTVATVDIVGGLATMATSAVRLFKGFDRFEVRDATLTPEVRTGADGGALLGFRLAF